MKNSPGLPLVGTLLALALSLAASSAAAVTSSVSVRSSQLTAEHLIYDELNAALNFVGPLHTSSSGALSWLSVAGDDSGTIACSELTTTAFKCNWRASLIQSYNGKVKVTFSKHAPAVVFSSSVCTNPKTKGADLPNLCALDPVPGMSGYQ